MSTFEHKTVSCLDVNYDIKAGSKNNLNKNIP